MRHRLECPSDILVLDMKPKTRVTGLGILTLLLHSCSEDLSGLVNQWVCQKSLVVLYVNNGTVNVSVMNSMLM